MSDPIWISAANAHHPESALSIIRADFGGSEQPIDPFLPRRKTRVKTLPNVSANDTWLTQDGLFRDATKLSWQ